ncbi:MAG TPA: TonB-dependent receptor [Bacteroidales bacterium]|nr:TonB-dependent receptor [Bacteroidales bacterium]HOM40486.1 TonB-dependent receptor [Bacteroidales bacterium]HRR16428.1 TonB-dependent receptor [Bacteroidales bacterium]HRT47884.1 TonB-dependent receptor [Bacteroidales bacterium]HRU56990.1 TonB-dependent receptor [Bacteroidales bacterium]
MTKEVLRNFRFRAMLGINFALKLVALFMLLAMAMPVFASSAADDGNYAGSFMQQKRVTGRITDAAGNPLPGVNIIEKGTTNGTISDADGRYQINVAGPASVLTFSFVGFVTQEKTVGDLSVIDVVLVEAVSALDEVVVIGYSTQARKTLTGAVSTVNATALATQTSASAIQRLQGKVAGVMILNAHTPGAGANIRIRGMTTINDASPLYVVDGVPGGTYAPNDVESITILKDAAAMSIYGARAANGVVLITTKSGRKNQKVSLNVNYMQGITHSSKFYDLLNTQEYGEMLWLEFKNAGLSPNHKQYGTGPTPVIPDYIFPAGAKEGDPGTDPSLYDNKLSWQDGTDTYLITKANKIGTDWFKEATRNGTYRDLQIDVAGGTQNTTYAFLLGYLQDDGIFKYTGYNRLNFRTTVNTSPAKWIDLGTTIGGNYTYNYGYTGNDNSESSIVSWCYRIPPIIPVFDISGKTYAGTRAGDLGNAQNPIFLLDKNQWDYTKSLNLSGNAFIRFNILKGLSIQSRIGVNYNSYFSNNINYVEVAHAERGTYDYLGYSAGTGVNWTWTNTAEYSIIFGQHNLKVIAGTEAYDTEGISFSASRNLFSFDATQYMTMNTGLRDITNSGAPYGENSLFSIFGRINYSFADKYLLEGVVRRDGSSRFGEKKYGIFPAVSLGWRITQESFMAATSSWLTDLKLRVGYGVVGNDRMGNYNSFTQFTTGTSGTVYGAYPFDGSNTTLGTTGFYLSSLGNTKVKWEKSTTTNIGIDATILKNLTINLDLWQKTTSDMLYPKQIPLVVGNVSSPSINIGEMKNTGIDLQLGYSNSALGGDLRYSADVVFTTYKNEVVRLTDVATDFYQGSTYREKIYTRTQSGRAFPEFFGWVCEGIFLDQAEVDAWPKAFGATGNYNAPGSFKYKDVDGNGYIDSNDRTYIGSPHPDFTAGLTLDVEYKGLYVNANFYASYGNEIVNYVRRFIDFTQFPSGKSKKRLYESWGSPYLNGDNSKATMPIIYSNDSRHQEPSTFFVEDGSYLRLRSLRVGYDLNRLLKNKLSNLQVYFQGTNLFTLTKYTGLDPEISAVGINMGIDSGAWPTPKQFIFGISFGL